MITEIDIRVPTQAVPSRRDYSRSAVPDPVPASVQRPAAVSAKPRVRWVPAATNSHQQPSPLQAPPRSTEPRPDFADDIDAMVKAMVDDKLIYLDIPNDIYRLTRQRVWKFA